MARGAKEKTNIGNAILAVFPGAFIDSDKKTIRIPCNAEDGPLEIKITLTCAKDIVGGVPAVPITEGKVEPQNTEMTDAEVQEVRNLIARLQL